MKIRAGNAESFVRAPDPAARVVLVYGPDDGLVRERADRLVAGAIEMPDDPFLVAELTGEAVAADPAILADEAAAIPLTGGRRAVRVRDASPPSPGAADKVAKAVAAFLEAPMGDALVVLQAGNLPPRAALRRLAEEAANAAALPCYADDVQAIDRLVDDVLGVDDVTATPEARAFLAGNLGSDRAISRSELEKLAIYAGPGGRVELADAIACVGDSALRSLDGVVLAAADGDRAELDRELTVSLQEDATPVSVLRAMARHMMRLHWTRGRIEAGARGRQALQGLQPPVFFMHQDRFLRQAERWSSEATARALALLLEAERQCKTTGTPAESICGRTLLQIATLARRR